MASFTDGNRKSFYPKSGVDLSAKQYYIVKLDAAGIVTLASAATDILVGTINNVDKSGQEVEVYLRNGGGTHKVIAGGSITMGNKLTADSAGKAVATTTFADQILGIAMSDASTGDIVEYMPSMGVVPKTS